MKKSSVRILLLGIIVSVFSLACSTTSSSPAEERRNLEIEARQGLEKLYQSTSSARILGEKAKAILVFPKITKGGFVVGGQYGEGVLFKNGRAVGQFRSVAASYGLQAGLQQFGYALFFMTESDLAYLDKSEGWEVGVGPSITVVDRGLASSMTTTTLREGVYAFFFGQEGLMAGLGVQGSKITRLD